MSSPYGPSGGNDPQQWGQPQQPYGGGPTPPGTPSGGFPAQGGGYPQQQPYGQQPYGQPGGEQQQQPGGYGQQPQPTQQYPMGGYPQQQPYGQQPGGYPPPGGYPGAPAKKSNTVLWIGVVVLVLAAGAFAVTAFFKPGFLVTKEFDQTAVQDGVKSILVDKYNIDKVESVSCPAGEEVKKDRQFSCKATIAGEERTVNITVRNDNGEYEVAPPSDK